MLTLIIFCLVIFNKHVQEISSFFVKDRSLNFLNFPVATEVAATMVKGRWFKECATGAANLRLSH